MDFAHSPTSQVLLLAAATVALLAVLIWRRSPRSYLVIVVVMLAVSRVSIDVGGFTLRADQLAVLILAAPVFGAARVGRSATRGAHRALAPLLLGYILVGALSRALDGAPTAEIMRATILIGIAVLAFWVPILLVRRGLTSADMTRCAVGVGAVAGTMGALLAAASYLSGSSLGVQPDASDPSLHLAYVSFYEANLLGVFLAATLILALLHPSVGTWRPAARTLVPLSIAAGLLATLTRGSWIGFAVGMIAGAFALRKHSPQRRRLWLRLCAVILVLVAFVAVSPLRSTITARVADAIDFSAGSGFGRVRISNLAMAEWRTSPLVGHGFLSFNQQLPGSPVGGTAWIPSLSVAVLHDTGAIGAAFMVLFFGLLMRWLWSQPDRTTAASWIGVSVCLLVAGQATQAQVLPFFWFLLGVASAATDSGTLIRGSQLRNAPPRRVGRMYGLST